MGGDGLDRAVVVKYWVDDDCSGGCWVGDDVLPCTGVLFENGVDGWFAGVGGLDDVPVLTLVVSSRACGGYATWGWACMDSSDGWSLICSSPDRVCPRKSVSDVCMVIDLVRS